MPKITILKNFSQNTISIYLFENPPFKRKKLDKKGNILLAYSVPISQICSRFYRSVKKNILYVLEDKGSLTIIDIACSTQDRSGNRVYA